MKKINGFQLFTSLAKVNNKYKQTIYGKGDPHENFKFFKA